MPSVDTHIDWGGTLGLSWRLVEMDASMWEAGETVSWAVSANVTRDAGGKLLESGSVTMEAPLDFEPREFWGRLEVIAEQGGAMERKPVATMLMTPGDMEIRRGRKLVPYDCQSVLKAAQDTVLPIGYSVPAGSDGASAAVEILEGVLPCPVRSVGSFALDDGIVLSRGTSRLDAAWMLVDAAGWCIQVCCDGEVLVREKPSEASLVIDTSNASLLGTSVRSGGVVTSLPTAYIAADGLLVARAEVEGSRVVEVYDDSPKRVNGETLDDYAERMLAGLRAYSGTRSYSRAWIPGLTLFDMVEGRLSEAGLEARMRITSQRFELGGEFMVEEEASVLA